MEVLKSERVISRIESPASLSFEGDMVYLWVIHANKIPPHLGISLGDAFYSLKANGKDEGLSITKILHVLDRKDIATVFYQIDKEALVKLPEAIFSQLERTIPEQTTCLEPLKQIFNDTEARWLKDLLQGLEAREMIQNAWGWQLPIGFERIPDYDPQDIHKRLKQLQNV
ncbi:MAG: hypothetical protein NXI10_12150 [bacterium]|nr:hypothetical protein [bacterium]